MYAPNWTFGLIYIGNICASINAATMALVDAGIPMNDFVSASAAGYIEDTPMLGGYGIPYSVYQ